MTDKKSAKDEPKAAPELRAPKGSVNRIIGAYFLAGAWHAADGSLLTDAEAQVVHRAMDVEAAKARAKALGGEL